jgi:hypothetical protein
MLRQRCRLIVVVVLGLVGGRLGLACHHEAERIRLANADNGRSIAVRVGEQFAIALEVPVGPVYYGHPVVSSDAVRFLGEFDELPGPPVNPGGGKTQRYEFEGVRPGHAEITIQRGLPTGERQVLGITVEVY